MGRDAIVRCVVLVACVASFGPGVAAAQTLTPEIHDFGDAVIDTVAPLQAFMFTNTLPVPATVTQVQFEGIDPASFSLAENACTQPLPPQAACALTVAFSPDDVGPANGILTVRFTSNGNPAEQRIGAQLTGNGTGAPPPPDVADLALALGLDALQSPPGGALVLTATASNLGPDGVKSLDATLTLPAAAANIQAEGVGWACVLADQTVACEHGSLAASAAAAITVQFSAPQALGTHAIDGVVASAATDPTPANNTASVDFDVVGTPPPPPPPANPVLRVPALDGPGIVLLALGALILGWRIRPR